MSTGRTVEFTLQRHGQRVTVAVLEWIEPARAEDGRPGGAVHEAGDVEAAAGPVAAGPAGAPGRLRRQVRVRTNGSTSVMDRPGLSGAHLLAALGTPPPWWQETTWLQRACDIAPEVDVQEVIALVRDSGEVEARLKYQTGPEPDWVWRVLACSPSPFVRGSVLRGMHQRDASTVPGDVVEAMTRHQDLVVRAEVARWTGAPPWCLQALAHDRDHDVRETLAANAGLPESLMSEMAADTDPSVRATLAAHRRLPQPEQQHLAADPSPHVRYTVAARPVLASAVASLLVDDVVDEVRDRARMSLTNARRRERAASAPGVRA